MIQFACDVAHPGCLATFQAPTVVEIVPLLTMHAWRSHDLHLPHLPAGTVKLVFQASRPVDVAMAEASRQPSAPVVLPAAQLIDVAGVRVAV